MLSTDLSMNFVRAFESYQIRWNIEVVNKETKGHLRLGSYMGRDFDGQIANATLCYITYYCCPIKPLYTAISSLNPAEIGMISSYFKSQAPH